MVKEYVNSDEEGVKGYGGKLGIRPKYKREFVYKDEQRNAVIETIRKGFPLNVMFWIKNSEDSFEALDGQQRSISICEYVKGNFAISVKSNTKYWSNLTSDEREQILDYELMVYFCEEGTESEKLDWFEVVNVAGVVLPKQELKNAVYTGPWLSDAKLFLNKTGCAASLIWSKYLNGAPIRQDYLETVLDWISNGNIKDYMSKHQHAPDAIPLT